MQITPRLSVEGPDAEDGSFMIRFAGYEHAITRAEADALIAVLNPWRDIASAPLNEPVIIGGGGCPYVHQNTLRDFGSVGRLWRGLGDEQQPTLWQHMPALPTERKE